MLELSNAVQAPYGWQDTIPNVFLRYLIGGKNGHRSWHWHFPAGERKSVIVRRLPPKVPAVFESRWFVMRLSARTRCG